VSLDTTALRELAKAELEGWQVPALEIVIVAEGEVVLADAFGSRDLERGLPAGPATLFQHGSTGKAFTAFLLGTLVDDGLVEWDVPVREYMPEFRLHDAASSDRVTVRDLLSHRSGLPRHEWAWLTNPSLPRAELVRRMRFLEPNAGLRQRWQYSNLGYTAAGHLAGVVTGSSWEEELKRRVFEPLGMSCTVTSASQAEAAGDHARPYERRGESVCSTTYRRLDNVAPAGQVISNAADTARWLLCQTEGGEVEGKRIISQDSLGQTHTVQMSTGSMLDSDELPHIRFHGYGLGWLVGSYRGRDWVWHNGGIDGFRTEMAVVPSARAGVAVCANLNNSQLPFAMLQHSLDFVLGLEPRAWTDEALERVRRARAGTGARERKRVEGTTPSHAAPDYEGSYEHPGYGRIEVSVAGEELRFRIGELDVEAEHRHYDTWDLRYPPLDASWPLTFFTDADGRAAEARVAFEPALEPLRFRRA
jgi:CubicO group peptidase (beta-lactamase class C family)